MAKKILSAAISPLGTLVGAVIGKKKAKPAPAAETPAVMPLPDDSKILAAKKRSIVRQRSRGGRDSTILSAGSRLGG